MLKAENPLVLENGDDQPHAFPEEAETDENEIARLLPDAVVSRGGAAAYNSDDEKNEEETDHDMEDPKSADTNVIRIQFPRIVNFQLSKTEYYLRTRFSSQHLDSTMRITSGGDYTVQLWKFRQ